MKESRGRQEGEWGARGCRTRREMRWCAHTHAVRRQGSGEVG
jgi:hypothetical protein